MALRLASTTDTASALGSSVIQPTVRVYTVWSPTLIRTAEIQADGGDLRRVADLCDWLLADDRIRGCLDTRAQALFGLEPQFEPSGDKRRSNRAVRALEADEDWWDSYPESENSLLLIWGILLGLAPAIHRWTDGGKDHDGRLMAKPEFWHPQHVRYDNTARRWLTKVASTTADFGMREVEIVPGDGDWIMHTPYGAKRPWAMGLWRGLALLALSKAYAETDWNRLGESASRNVVESDKEVKDSKEKRAELATDIATMGRDGTIVLAPGFKYKLVESGASSKDIYDTHIDSINESIAIAIRGGNLSTSVTDGSRAAAESQAKSGEQPKLRFDAQAFTTTIHDQSLVHWAERNFGDAGLAPWPVYPVQQSEDLKVKAETMGAAATALQKFQQLGFDIDREEFAETFELSDFLKVPKGEPAIAPKVEPAPAPKTPVQPDNQEAGNTTPTPGET